MTADQAYAKYSKAMAKLHKDAIPNEPLPAFYHSKEYLDKWGKLTDCYHSDLKRAK